MVADTSSFYNYAPSVAAAVIFCILFSLFTLLHLYQMVRTRTWFFTAFVFGGLFEIIGFIGRVMNAKEYPSVTLAPYILQAFFLLVAPTLFSASVYMILGRIIVLTNGEGRTPIRKEWLTKVFVLGDVLSFVIQAAGASLLTSKNPKTIDLGQKIVVVGLAIQIISFSFFLIVCYLFHTRMRKSPTEKALGGRIPWEKHVYVLYVASALIFIRSVFRFIEYVQGYQGYLISHEVFMYIFDSTLMFLTMAIFAWYHPSEITALAEGGRARAIRMGVHVYTTV